MVKAGAVRISKFISAVCVALALPVLAAGIVCLVNPADGLLYLIDIFTQAILTVSVLLTLAILLLRRYAIAAVGGIGIALMLVSIVPPDPDQLPVDADARPVTLMWSNMFVRNPVPQKILPWIAKKQPDIVVLVEVANRQREALSGILKDSYPHVVVVNDMVVASKYPVTKPRARVRGFAAYLMTVNTPHGRINLVAAHLTRPWPYTPTGVQPYQFDHLYDGLKPIPETKMILVGDFNSSPYAAHIRDFARRRNMSVTYGLAGTWPSVLPAFGRGSIDNVLVSRDLRLTNRDVGPYVGSDHSPVYVEIRPTKKAN
jgi:endonuclease/exonuclease/phosphatase (EEP) superfamily protein YafD